MTNTAPPEVRQRTLAKARVLLEALPYFREHAGSIVVIKVGGAAMDAGRLAESFAQDVALLRLVGVRPVIVHGGGPQITEMAARLGLEASFVDGHRVTDAATLEVARMVLLGLVNQDVVSHLVRQGTSAVGLSGGDDALLVVRPRAKELGLVGEVERVNTSLLLHLMERVVPVIASIGTDPEGQAYNVNADLVAGAVAAALGAEKLVYLTDVPGLLDGDGELVSETSVTGAQTLLASGVADGGMIPKLESAIGAMQAGVRRAHLIDGRVEHALILELFTPEGLGTMLTQDADPLAAALAEGVPT
ncbi:MAG: acetylglutamate kinase [Actinomycetota bacterium]